jgi:hypothetical protein
LTKSKPPSKEKEKEKEKEREQDADPQDGGSEEMKTCHVG